jgi:hypothetical protein
MLKEYLAALRDHLVYAPDDCPCRKKDEKGRIPPPYRLIVALFRTSAKLRYFLLSEPSNWNRQIVTSDKFFHKKDDEEFEKWKEKLKPIYAKATQAYRITLNGTTTNEVLSGNRVSLFSENRVS